MSVSLLKLEADLELSLASAVNVGATSATLSSAVNADGDTLVSGKYGFTIDSDNSAKEFIICDLVGTALTNILSVDLQGATTSGFANYHRIGAMVTITDWAILDRVLNNLTGETGFDSGAPLKYDGQPLMSDPLTIPTVQFVLDTASGGAVSFNATVIAGDAGEVVSSGDWVYFNTTDGEWYKTDADDVTKSVGVQLGKARGAGVDGGAISGGVFIAGLETVGTYVAGTTYYLSNTAGELATSAGTNTVVVGVGDANGELPFRIPSSSQVDAMQGDGATPSFINPYVTKIRRMTAGATINGATLPVPVYQNTTSNKYLACDGNDLATLKFQGFAISNSTDTNPISIQFNGVVDGFTGLTEGVAYYLSDTVGTIQATPGTYLVQVGIAISETQLLIQKGVRNFSGSSTTGTSGGSVAVSCGFRPRVVRIFAFGGASTYITQMTAIWANGVIVGANAYYNEASEGAPDVLPQIVTGATGNYFTFSVGTVTETGCTISWSETGNAANCAFSYEIEGDF